MTDSTFTRRSILAAGGGLTILGYAGSQWYANTTSTPPGADGFSAGTVPESSDPLLVVRPDDGTIDTLTASVTTGLLERTDLDATPGLPTDLLDADDSSGDLRKLAAVGSTQSQQSAVVAWTDWQTSDLLERLERAGAGEPTSTDYQGRTLHVADDAAAVALTDGVSALGSTDHVRAILDAWHGDAPPVDDAVLDPFERTTRTAPVRLATTGFAFHDVTPSTRTDAYAPIVNASIDARTDGGDATVTTTYEVRSRDDTEDLAAALERDLGLTDDAAPVEPALPRGIRSDLTVSTDPAIVRIDYTAPTDSVTEHVDDVMRTIAAVTAPRE